MEFVDKHVCYSGEYSLTVTMLTVDTNRFPWKIAAYHPMIIETWLSYQIYVYVEQLTASYAETRTLTHSGERHKSCGLVCVRWNIQYFGWASILHRESGERFLHMFIPLAANLSQHKLFQLEGQNIIL